jgi:hypothetical protein
MIIYLSHPYTGNEKKNVAHASSIARILAKQHTVLSPINNFTFVDGTFAYSRIIKMCLDLLSKSDKLVYFGGSKGVRIEIEWAKKWGIPIEEWKDQSKQDL